MKEKFKTMHNVFDEHTNRNLFRLISRGYFEGLVGPISVGKESNVFWARTKENGKLIVKIYRLQTADFNRMYDYIKDDPRFINLKKNRRKIIFGWCRREYKNLLMAREAGVPAPLAITFLDNILVEEFIGDVNVARKIKDHIPQDSRKFFEEIIKNIKRLYKHGFVHSDLSHFNILNYKNNPVFIDWSHCTPVANPNSIEYLNRDVDNICNFFIKLGLRFNKEKIFKSIIDIK